LTREKSGLTVVIAMNYGGRDEIRRMAQALCRDTRDGKIDPGTIDEAMVSGYLDTADLPDPALLIRTSGEMRLSNFLLWQLAYTEFYFTDVLWPDFGARDLQRAIEDYQNRDRRFGGRK